MYEHLTGRLVARGLDGAVLDVGGVGYRLLLSASSAAALGPLGAEQTLFVRHVLREDCALLYGFTGRPERALFDALCSVSKVGPATALALLSGLAPSDLARAVEAGDVRTLSQVKGIGKRTAERLCVELRGRLALELDGAAPHPAPPDAQGERVLAVAAALAALGFPRRAAAAAAEDAVRDLPADAPLEALVKRGLAAGRAEPGPPE